MQDMSTPIDAVAWLESEEGLDYHYLRGARVHRPMFNLFDGNDGLHCLANTEDLFPERR